MGIASTRQFGALSTGTEVAAALPGAGRGKVALITGGNAGLGLETARVLASQGVEVILASRSQKNADEAVSKIKQQLGADAKVSSVLLDLTDQKQIAAAAKSFAGSGRPLHLLINNAGVMACPFSVTKDGFEMQWGTNHMGHFTLTHHLLPTLKASGTPAEPARIVNLSSMGNFVFSPADGVKWATVHSPTLASYNPWAAYGQSKLANIVHARELNKRMAQEGANVIAVSVHPGAILSTNLGSNAFSSWGNTLSMLAFAIYPRTWYLNLTEKYKTTEQGVATTIMAALAPLEGRPGRTADTSPGRTPALTVQPGQHYSDCALDTYVVHPKANDESFAKKVWDESEAAMRKALI